MYTTRNLYLVLVVLLPHGELDHGDRSQNLHPRGERQLSEGLQPWGQLPVVTVISIRARQRGWESVHEPGLGLIAQTRLWFRTDTRRTLCWKQEPIP